MAEAEVEEFSLAACRSADALFFLPREETRPNMPPGFEPAGAKAYQITPLPPEYNHVGGFRLWGISCQRGNVSGRSLEDVRFFTWYIRVSPPPQYLKGVRDPGAVGIVWFTTPDVSLSKVFSQWGIGGFGDVKVERVPGLGGTVQWHIHAQSNGTTFDVDSIVTPTPAPPEFSAKVRYFGVDGLQVRGGADVNITGGPTPMAGQAEYRIQNGRGAFNRPSGRTEATAGDAPIVSFDFQRIPLPEAA